MNILQSASNIHVSRHRFTKLKEHFMSLKSSAGIYIVMSITILLILTDLIFQAPLSCSNWLCWTLKPRGHEDDTQDTQSNMPSICGLCQSILFFVPSAIFSLHENGYMIPDDLADKEDCILSVFLFKWEHS